MIRAVIHSIKALTTTWKRPSVRMYSGIDKNCTIGLMIALTRPKITATTKMMPTLCKRRVAAHEGQAVDELGDDPQRKPSQCGANQKRAHVERSCHRTSPDVAIQPNWLQGSRIRSSSEHRSAARSTRRFFPAPPR